MSIHSHHTSSFPRNVAEFSSSSNTSSATSLDSSTASTGASSPTSSHQIEYLVPDKAVSIIIGVGGQTMLEIQSSYSVQCQISRQNEKKESSDEMMRKVLLKGAPEKVQQARCRLEALVEQYYSRRK